MAEIDITAYVHVPENYLFEEGWLDGQKLSDEAARRAKNFMQEHEIEVKFDLETGFYRITHVDGNAVDRGEDW